MSLETNWSVFWCDNWGHNQFPVFQAKRLIRFILYCLTHNILFIANHVPAVNELADALSHFQFRRFQPLEQPFHQMSVPAQMWNLGDERCAAIQFFLAPSTWAAYGRNVARAFCRANVLQGVVGVMLVDAVLAYCIQPGTQDNCQMAGSHYIQGEGFRLPRLMQRFQGMEGLRGMG